MHDLGVYSRSELLEVNLKERQSGFDYKESSEVLFWAKRHPTLDSEGRRNPSQVQIQRRRACFKSHKPTVNRVR